ncbi:hypothetical protein BJ742DRAFT_744424 [Cladochytrium replicatum]|nr:hypothetical protein BJ742DRAFT_744424 [Cladochytrium replicatum]
MSENGNLRDSGIASHTFKPARRYQQLFSDCTRQLPARNSIEAGVNWPEKITRLKQAANGTLRIAKEHAATHRIVIASRRLAGVNSAVESIQKLLKKHEKGAVVACGVPLDLNSLESAKSFAVCASKEYPTLYALVLNAGTVPPSIVLSKDGLESTFAVNHAISLTQLLLHNILGSTQTRVIVISSGMHNPIIQLTFRLGLRWSLGVRAPLRVPLILQRAFAHELHARVADPRLTILVFHPGFCQTTGLRRGITWGFRSIVENGIKAFLWIKDVNKIHPHVQLITAEESGGMLASFVVDDKLVSSDVSPTPFRYFSIATETESSVDSYNKEYQRLLW